MDIEVYQNLANAIIIQACEDYKNNILNNYSFEAFCRSDWFRVLTKVDPEYLIEKMKKEKVRYLIRKMEKEKEKYLYGKK